MSDWLEHVSNGEAYAAEDFILGAPGLFAHLQLFNPIGSGKRIRLRSVHVENIIPTTVNIRRYDPPGVTLGPPVPFIVENMLGGGPPEVAELRHANIVIGSGPPFWLLQMGASSPSIYPVSGQEWGHDLLEGHGILVSNIAANQLLIANWMWVELPL